MLLVGGSRLREAEGRQGFRKTVENPNVEKDVRFLALLHMQEVCDASTVISEAHISREPIALSYRLVMAGPQRVSDLKQSLTDTVKSNPHASLRRRQTRPIRNPRPHR